jgi:hypothetical protein
MQPKQPVLPVHTYTTIIYCMAMMPLCTLLLSLKNVVSAHPAQGKNQARLAEGFYHSF